MIRTHQFHPSNCLKYHFSAGIIAARMQAQLCRLSQTGRREPSFASFMAERLILMKSEAAWVRYRSRL